MVFQGARVDGGPEFQYSRQHRATEDLALVSCPASNSLTKTCVKVPKAGIKLKATYSLVFFAAMENN